MDEILSSQLQKEVGTELDVEVDVAGVSLGLGDVQVKRLV